MNGPRIQADERGITLNKTLAWTMLATIVSGGIWVGSEVTAARRGLEDLRQTQVAMEERTAADFAIVRGDAANRETRLRAVEATIAAGTAETLALRRDLTELKIELREIVKLLRERQP